MIHNPERIKWSAPTERVDGSPITGTLSYELWVDGERFMTLPAVLNPDGLFEAPITDWDYGQYTVYLTAIETYEDGKSKESEPSNSETFIVTAAPKAPVLVAVE